MVNNWQLLFALVCSLLVLDEMDSLDCKSQDVLYTIFEYPSLAKSKLILVGQSEIVKLCILIGPSQIVVAFLLVTERSDSLLFKTLLISFVALRRFWFGMD